jgi:DNA-binding MarR family transcriptional regulator
LAKEDFDEVERFVRTSIGSVGQLEILLLLHSLRGERRTARQINEELRSSRSSVENRLSDLEKRGLIASEGSGEGRTYRYSPRAADLAACIDRLSMLYDKYRGRIIDLIFSSGDQMRSFSDAFRFKDEEDEPHA